MLNEMFTGNVPHGTDYRLIAGVAPDYGYLDGIVSQMIKQNPAERPGSILDVKRLIQRHQEEAVSLQRLSKINETVVRAGEIDEPLAQVAPVLLNADWENGLLRLTLNRAVTNEWVNALQNMGNFTSLVGAEPHNFQFRGATATVQTQENSAQMVIDYFKAWLPQATRVLKQRLEEKARQEEARQREQLRQEREAEERRLRVNRNLRV
jgi:hypothetical protein